MIGYPSRKDGAILPARDYITSAVSRKKNFPRKPYNKFFTDQVCSVMIAGYETFFVSLWTSTLSRSINRQKNLAFIQPTWPHTWSITHTSVLTIPGLSVCIESTATLIFTPVTDSFPLSELYQLQTSSPITSSVHQT